MIQIPRSLTELKIQRIFRLVYEIDKENGALDSLYTLYKQTKSHLK